MAKRRSRIRVTIDEDVNRKLKQVSEAIGGREVPKIMHGGAVVMGAPAKAAAPVGGTGNLRAGVYVTSQYRNDYVQLTRRGRNLNSPLKSGPRPRQALVVASTYYTRFVEYGRKPRIANADAGNKRLRRTVGKLRRRPFFQRTMRRWRRSAEAVITRQLARMVEREWQR